METSGQIKLHFPFWFLRILSSPIPSHFFHCGLFKILDTKDPEVLTSANLNTCMFIKMMIYLSYILPLPLQILKIFCI